MTAILKVDTIQDTSGNNIINESSDTITIGASGDTTNIVGTLQNNGSALNFATVNGITQADQWRTTTDQTISADTDTLVSGNWERNDTNSTYIGSGMSVSSGIWTFPSTGLYLILNSGDWYGTNSASDYCSTKLHGTSNNSSYVTLNNNNQGITAGDWMTVTSINWFDCTNVSTHKVKLIAHAQGSAKTLRGNTAYTETCLTFIRLGDT